MRGNEEEEEDEEEEWKKEKWRHTRLLNHRPVLSLQDYEQKVPSILFFLFSLSNGFCC